jgi:hypothetical protein
MSEDQPSNFTDRVGGKNKPIHTFKAGKGVEVSLWQNQGKNGDLLSASIRHSYKDGGEWKSQTASLPTDALAGLSIAAADGHRAAVQERGKSQNR